MFSLIYLQRIEQGINKISLSIFIQSDNVVLVAW